jgi:hypothetical protein
MDLAARPSAQLILCEYVVNFCKLYEPMKQNALKNNLPGALRLWEGEKVFWNSVERMQVAGYDTIQRLPGILLQESRREGNKGQQPWIAPKLVRTERSDGLRRFQVLIPRGIVHEREKGVLQRWVDMIDWQGNGVNKNGRW